jgi:60 kDa SS-A/Ro ribonucleoprotein
MLDYTKHFATRLARLVTPQSEPIRGTGQVPNSAGGYAWPVSEWDRLDRFLVLGSEGGTFYVRERKLTIENARVVEVLVREQGEALVKRVVELSVSGRAATNDPALFALAMAASLGDEATRKAALAALPEVARTGTHLFHWLRFVTGFRGWGRGVRRAVADWYVEKPGRKLAYQVLKYPSRDGWAHRDALRLAHPKPTSQTQDVIFRLATSGWKGLEAIPEGIDPEVRSLLEGVRALGDLDPGEAATRIAELRLVREMVPTPLLRHPEVWEALLEEMPMGAMIRNLATMTRVGLVAPGSDATARVVERLGNEDRLTSARIHPIAVLAALKTYAQGRGVRGRGSWEPVAPVVDALDGAFYATFQNAPTTGKRVMLALDVSYSMSTGVHGMDYLSCCEASAAMALVTAATEPKHMFTAFTAAFSILGPSGLSTLSISPRERLDDVVRRIDRLNFGGTDCALPMLEATKRGWSVDVFVVYTDNETWAGRIHPSQALRQYREKTGIPARLVVVGMASNGFTIADPADGGMLDVVGFDTATPRLIAEFVR